MLTRGNAGGDKTSKAAFFTSPAGLVLLVLLAVAGTYLWTEHRAHLLGALLFLPLLACTHLFMHHGHGGHSKQTGSDPPPGTGPLS